MTFRPTDKVNYRNSFAIQEYWDSQTSYWYEKNLGNLLNENPPKNLKNLQRENLNISAAGRRKGRKTRRRKVCGKRKKRDDGKKDINCEKR